MLLVLAAASVVCVALVSRRDKTGPRDVLIITLDTLRADALGPDTPAINDFLRGATHFARARTVAPLTLPAHASLFTGLLPCTHGVHDNAGAPVAAREARDFPLLAEEFRDAGYATAGFAASAVLGARTGVASGFDTFACPASETERSADDQVSRARSWLARRDGRRFFLWVHLFDPHREYLPFPGDDRRAATLPTDPARVRYAGEVRRTDAAVEALLRAVPEDTIVVLASDHGEGLGDHGEPTHGPLCYATTIDAVLAVRTRELARGVDRLPRSLCDVAPSLRAWCRLAPRPADGRSLRSRNAVPVVSESLFAYRIHGWGQCFAASDGRYTLVESGRSVELFDRETDPDELHPIGLDHPAYERLDRALGVMRARGATAAADNETLATVAPYAFLRRPFRACLDRRANARLPDPRMHLGPWSRLERLAHLVDRAVVARDTATLRGLVTELQRLETGLAGSPRRYEILATVQCALGGLARDHEMFRQAIASLLQAVERGLVVSRVFRQALVAAMSLADRNAVDTLVARALETGLVADRECARSFFDAARAGMVDRRRVVLILERTRATAAPADATEIDGWIAALRDDR